MGYKASVLSSAPGQAPISPQPYSTRARGVHRIAGARRCPPGPTFQGALVPSGALRHGYRAPKRDSSAQSRNVDRRPTGRRPPPTSQSVTLNLSLAEAKPSPCFMRARVRGTRAGGMAMLHDVLNPLKGLLRREEAVPSEKLCHAA